MKSKISGENTYGEEYKIITGNDSENQMKLNQWRHKYHIVIYAMCATGNHTTILLSRRELDPFPVEECKSEEDESYEKGNIPF